MKTNKEFKTFLFVMIGLILFMGTILGGIFMIVNSTLWRCLFICSVFFVRALSIDYIERIK